MQPFISHQSIISVLLSNSASRCQALVQEVHRTVTVNNSTQPVCNISTVYRHQLADQLLNCQEYQRRASMLENGSQEDVHVKRFLLHIRHRLAAKTCADALKSLSTAAELAGVQFNSMKAVATAV